MPIRITHIDPTPIDSVSFLTIPTGSHEPKDFSLPIFIGTVSGLPDDCDALVVASDLQGVLEEGETQCLLGDYLARHLQLLIELYYPKVHCGKTTVFLCGDLYADLEKRGQGGSPLPVWEAFSENFANVVGIAGNHDHFDDEKAFFEQTTNAFLLEHETLALGGLTIGGLSGIIGRTDKPNRLAENDYLLFFKKLIKSNPDVLLTHLSPAFEGLDLMGEKQLGSTDLLKGNDFLLLCGHAHWDTSEPVHQGNIQILNADSKCYLLINEKLQTTSPFH